MINIIYLIVVKRRDKFTVIKYSGHTIKITDSIEMLRQVIACCLIVLSAFYGAEAQSKLLTYTELIVHQIHKFNYL